MPAAYGKGGAPFSPDVVWANGLAGRLNFGKPTGILPCRGKLSGRKKYLAIMVIKIVIIVIIIMSTVFRIRRFCQIDTMPITHTKIGNTSNHTKSILRVTEEKEENEEGSDDDDDDCKYQLWS